VWGILCMLLVCVANVIWQGYGQAFLDMAASFYPGYRAEPGLGQVAVATGYGLADGAMFGAVLAWAYNRFATITAPPTERR